MNDLSRDLRTSLPAPDVVGFIDRLQTDLVIGWVHDTRAPGKPVSFTVMIDDDHQLFEIASIFRADVLASGHAAAHVGFAIPIPKAFQDGRPHTLTFLRDDGSYLLLCDPNTQISSHCWMIGVDHGQRETTAAEASVIVTVDTLANGSIAGWAYDEAALDASARLRMVIDGETLAEFTADGARADVLNAGHPHALVGFTQRIPSRFCDDRSHSLTLQPGDGGVLRAASGQASPSWSFRLPSIAISGQVDGLHEGAIRGWVLRHDHLADRRTGGLAVLVTHRGQPVGQVTANQFRADVAETHDCDPNCGFAFVPATELVAGRALELRFRVLPDGPELKGSPYTAHFPALDAYRQVREMLSVADTLFTQMWALRSQLKAMLPAEQHSLATYDSWAQRYRIALAARPATAFADMPLISVICPSFRPRLKDFQAAVQSVIAQSYPNWELIIVDDCSQRPELDALIAELAASDSRIHPHFLAENAGISGATNAAIELVRGEFVAFFDHDDLMAPRALEFMLEAAQRTGARLLYCDEDKIDDSGFYSEVNFKPDWNYRLLLAQNYVCHLLFVNAANLRQAGKLQKHCDGAQDHDMILRLAEITPPGLIHHVPEVLYHWRKTPTSTASSGKSKSYAVQAGITAVSEHLQRRGVAARVTSPFDATFYAIEWIVAAPPKVTIIIPFREHIALTRACVHAILDVTVYPNFEIVLVDNWSISAEAEAFATEVEAMPTVRIIRVERAFNYSELNNIAVAATTGEMLVFLNNDVFVRQANWLEQMVGEVCADPTTAIVGVKLLYPNGLVQHAGVVLGVGGVADHSFRGLQAHEPGYMARAICAQDLSGVTAACMLCRREVFDAVGGFDAVNLHVAFNDVDLCLKTREAGYRAVWTPQVSAEHRESLSRGSDFKPEHQARFFAENQFMKHRWRGTLANDEHYSRFFSRRSGLFRDLVEPDDVFTPSPERGPGLGSAIVSE
jgi:glycosyltransferase involved in cell wall biosynthesis